MNILEDRIRLLLVMEQCNPEWPSVPRVAYQFYNQLRQLCQVTLVTHERNRQGLMAHHPEEHIEFIEESRLVREYYGVVARITSRGGVNWPLQHTLSYPVYAEFDSKVASRFSPLIESGEFDAVMGMTPILPRYPYRLSGHSDSVPFILGPVNGGLPFPEGFGGIAAKEGARFNFLRQLTQLHPGYRRTYERADRIIAGSLHTLNWISKTFEIDSRRLRYMAENGVADSFFENPIEVSPPEEPLKLLFAGRLVPYKGGDMLLEAFNLASRRSGRPLELTFVGDGPERERLEKLAVELEIADSVHFTGQVPPETMPDYFREADLFTFPSIREFGGAVVLEAMATGLPCVVADHGGIGEYVIGDAGVKVPPKSREYLIGEFAEAIASYADQPALLIRAAKAARSRAEEYRWPNKAQELVELIGESITEKQMNDEVALSS